MYCSGLVLLLTAADCSVILDTSKLVLVSLDAITVLSGVQVSDDITAKQVIAEETEAKINNARRCVCNGDGGCTAQ